VISTAQSVESAYWNLVYAIDNLRARQHSLMLARTYWNRPGLGCESAPWRRSTSCSPRQPWQRAKVDIIQAENAIGNAGDVLRASSGSKPEDWKSRIVPTDALEVTTEHADLDKAIAGALEKRPELRQRQLELEIGEVDLLAARNAVSPSSISR